MIKRTVPLTYWLLDSDIVVVTGALNLQREILEDHDQAVAIEAGDGSADLDLPRHDDVT